MASRFSLDISKWVEKAGARADLVVRNLMLEMGGKIILKSPADTGRFRGNWQSGINHLPTGVLDVLDKSGSIAIGRLQAAMQGVKAGDTVYFANNVAYAVRLEFGHSKQAPNGMVRVTVEEYQAAVNRAASAAKQEIQ